MNLPLVMVEWEDHSSDSCWRAMSEIPNSSKPAICWTIGWLVYEDDKVINVCNSYIEMNQDEKDQLVGGESVILKSDIVSQKTLCVMASYQ